MHALRKRVPLLLSLLALALPACGGDEPDTCRVGTAEGCEQGLVCEPVVGGETPAACFAPVEITGRVFDMQSSAAVVDATVLALDANGGARSTVVRSLAPDGTYRLPVSVPRAPDGKPQHELVTLRVAALGYQAFPTAPRTALPIALDQAARDPDAKKPWLIKSATTDVALLALPGGATNLGAISGRIDVTGLQDVSPGGVLLMADQGGKAIATAVSGGDGTFVIFNVPAGAVTVTGYRRGLRVAPTPLTLALPLLKDVVLKGAIDGMGSVSGSVNMADAPGGAKTSVLLVVESTFTEEFKRGEAPAGLRVGDVSGPFTFEQVPPGRYVVLAAFENDGLVRDPDVTIGGTQIQHVEVNGGPVQTADGFKITGALAILSPGATGLEVIPPGDPVMKWKDDSSEEGYEIVIYDAFGTKVHEKLDLPKVTGADVSYTWTGASLTKGMIYQFRATSFRVDKNQKKFFISSTEDLLGVFQAP